MTSSKDLEVLKKEVLSAIRAGKKSEEIDQFFHLFVPSKVKELNLKEAYTDLPLSAEALYTSYQDLLMVRESLINKAVKSFTDIGSGIGRAKVLFDFLDSPFRTDSIEIVQERHQAGIKAHSTFQLKDSDGFINANLLNFPLPKSDSFLIYLPVGPTLFKVLEELKILSTQKDVYLYVIESHGDLISFLEDQLPSLKLLENLTLHSKRHHPDVNVYQLESCASSLAWQDHALDRLKLFKENCFLNLLGLPFHKKWFLMQTLSKDQLPQLLIQEEDFAWLGSLEEVIPGIDSKKIEIKFPPRIVECEKIQGILYPPQEIQEYISKRRLSSEGLRKLIVSPTPQVEYAGGEKRELKIQWSLERATPLVI